MKMIEIFNGFPSFPPGQICSAGATVERPGIRAFTSKGLESPAMAI
jgi:hypothetical protein